MTKRQTMPPSPHAPTRPHWYSRPAQPKIKILTSDKQILAPEEPNIPLPTIHDHCTGCGRCVAACPFGALSLETEQPNGFGQKRAVIAEDLCTGCMACPPACPHQAISEFPDLDPDCR